MLPQQPWYSQLQTGTGSTAIHPAPVLPWWYYSFFNSPSLQINETSKTRGTIPQSFTNPWCLTTERIYLSVKLPNRASGKRHPSGPVLIDSFSYQRSLHIFDINGRLNADVYSGGALVATMTSQSKKKHLKFWMNTILNLLQQTDANPAAS